MMTIATLNRLGRTDLGRRKSFVVTSFALQPRRIRKCNGNNQSSRTFAWKALLQFYGERTALFVVADPIIDGRDKHSAV